MLTVLLLINFDPVPYPKNDYGKFYTGDSYIVLNTVQGKDKKFSWDLHFWLGSETSQDEAGAAAILAVQLDDQLNGAPVQHREVQNHESQLFLSHFKNGIRYEEGGIGTGFRHVETNAAGEKRLFQVKGKRNVRVVQVNLSVSSMNKGDCFILDAGNQILLYVGATAKRIEKIKAISAANQIRDQDHNGRARIDIIDEFSSDIDKQNFFTVLGSGAPDQVPEESAAVEDSVFESTDAAAVTLYKVSDASGKLKVEPISTKPLRQEMLDTRDCFILDTGSGIYVWVGKASTRQEKTDAMSKAQEFLRTKKYPAWTQIHRIVEGAESAPFKQYFFTWRDAGMTITRLIRSALGYDTDDSSMSADEIDSVGKKLKKSGGQALGFMPDKGQNDILEITQYYSKPGTNEIAKRTVPFDIKLPLLSFACFIIPYKYTAKNGDIGNIIYLWQGAESSDATRELAWQDAMYLAIEKKAMLVRAPQNHEPRHFLKIFSGRLLTVLTNQCVRPQLFRIRGTDESDVHALEVPCDSSSLASRDVFALVKQGNPKIQIWIGLGASEFEKQMAQDRFQNYWAWTELEIIEEGAEPNDFWEDLKGEGIYDRSLTEESPPILEPRLFHWRFVGDQIVVEEISNFEQADLDVDDIMLVDGGDEIYMWVGSGATADENSKILEMAKKYIQHEPTARTIDTVSIIRVAQYEEPKCFKRMFPSWANDYWESIPSYEDVKKQVQEDNDRLFGNDV